MIERLKQLGWGDYEARAYLALLRGSPATGYRIGKESGVPTAKVYEALARLLERGAIRALPTAEGETARYVPVPPEEVLAGVRARHLHMLDELGRELIALRARADAPESEWLRGLAPILGRLESLLVGARKSIALVLPSDWEGALRASLESAQARRVRVDKVLSETAESELFVLVVDGAQTLIGALDAADRAAEAFATRAPFLTQLGADYVRMRRALALMPAAVARLQRHDDWLDWEEAKQRRLLQKPNPPASFPASFASLTGKGEADAESLPPLRTQ